MKCTESTFVPRADVPIKVKPPVSIDVNVRGASVPTNVIRRETFVPINVEL